MPHANLAHREERRARPALADAFAKTHSSSGRRQRLENSRGRILSTSARSRSRTSTVAQDLLYVLFDEDDSPTVVANFDLAAYARATAEAEAASAAAWREGNDPPSGIRPSFPTLNREVGALPNEPEADALLRVLGGGDRELRVHVPVGMLQRYDLTPRHGYLLGILDGVTSLTEVLDISTLPRVSTLRALEDLVFLGVIG